MKVKLKIALIICIIIGVLSAFVVSVSGLEKQPRRVRDPHIHKFIKNDNKKELRNTNDVIVGTGRISYIFIEGGFPALIADNGVSYDIAHTKIPRNCQYGDKVIFAVKHKVGLICFHMYGKIVDIIFMFPIE